MSCRYSLFCGVAVWLLWAAFASDAAGQTANYFRRDHGRAMNDDVALPAELDDKSLVWKTALPQGHSTPTIVGERILLTGREGNELSTIALDRATGDLVWKQSLHVDKLEPTHAEGGPAAASVACDGRRVVAFFGSYGLVCYAMNGDPQWTRKMGPFRDEFGAPSSPILLDDKVILCEDHDLDSFLMAVHADTGETAWQAQRDGFTRSYATPVVWEMDGRRQIVMAGALQLVAYQVADGRPVWSRDGFSRIVNTTPALVDGMLYVCAWSPGGDNDARIGMEPWQQALAMWDQNKNAQLEKKELPAGEVQSRFFRIDLDSNQALDEPEWNKYARLFELAQNSLTALRPADDGGPPQLAWEYKRGLSYVASPLDLSRSCVHGQGRRRGHVTERGHG